MTMRRYTGNSARSIRSLPVGPETVDVFRPPHLSARPAPRAAFDYDHLLPEYARDNGFALRVYEDGDRLQACLGHEGDQIGHWRGELFGVAVQMGRAHLDKQYRDGGLGRCMLLALLAHAAHRGALLARGGIHSTSAHHAHESIAREFGLDYRAALREGMEDMEEKPEDQRYDEYDYTLDRPGPSRK